MSGILPQSIRNLEFAELVVFDTGVKVDNDTRKSPYDNDDDDDDDDDEEEKKEGGENDDDEEEEEVLLTKSQIVEANQQLYTLFSRIDVPRRYEDRSPKNPDNFGPTCLDGLRLNRLHANGFTTLLPEREPNGNRGFNGPVHCTRWFSRKKTTTTTTSQVDNNIQGRPRSSIIFDNDVANDAKHAGNGRPVTKQFALLQGDAFIANVGNKIQMRLDSCDGDWMGRLEKPKVTIAAQGSEKELLTWLPQNDYSRDGEEFDNLFQSIQRGAGKHNRRGWPSSTVPVQVWSKPTIRSSNHAPVGNRVADTNTTTNSYPPSPYSTMVTEVILDNYSTIHSSSSRTMTGTTNTNCCVS